MNDGWQTALRAGVSERYRILQEIGGGGMSATFIAEEVALGRNVVLKALPASMSNHVNAERFEREIHVAARLQHAFIVPLLAAGITDGHPWYTMPLVHGDSLRTRLSREGAMPPTAVARVLRDVAEALAHAHEQGVVHRDIKPDNILLSGAHALVTDFGVAKALAASTAGSGITEIGVALGTPAYMAPEQAAGDGATDHRADLYALGATGYEMLTGRPMFGQRTPAQHLIAHATESPEPLAKLVPAAPAELTRLMEQLLAKHPNDRPTHAQNVADALGAMLTRWSSGELAPAPGHMTLGRALPLWGASFAGVAIAAWLAVRWLPVPDWTFVAAILVMLAGLPVIALSAWLHRPPKPVAATPSVSSTTTVGRLEAALRPHLSWRRAKMGGVTAVGGLVLLVTAWGVSRATGIGPAATLRSRGIVAATDRVLVADFDAPANDSSLGIVVSDLLQTELGRSESLKLVDAAERSRLLEAMGRRRSDRVSTDIASDMAQRAGAKVYLSGSVTALGSGYLVRATMIEATTGREVASFTESASTPDELIDAADRMGREVRDQLGASLREIRSAEPLTFAVTPSLTAARLFSEGTRLARQGDQLAAIPVLERAVQADSTFSMAYRTLSAYFGNQGFVEASGEAAELAFRYRDKLPPIMQRYVEGTYYERPLAFDLDKSIQAYQAIVDINPTVGRNNLAVVYLDKRDPARALIHFERALASDTTSDFAPYSILQSYWALGQKEQARAHLSGRLTRWQPGSNRLLGEAAHIASADFFVDSSMVFLERIMATGVDSLSTRGIDTQRRIANGYLAQGRVNRSSGVLDHVLRLGDKRRGIPEVILTRTNAIALVLGQTERSRVMLDSAIAANPPGQASALGYRWLEVARAYAHAKAPAKAKQYLAEYERLTTPSIERYDRQELELARGWIAIAEERYDDAVQAFRAADVYDCTICALAPLAHAYDLAGQSDSAVAVFERYLATNFLFRARVDAFYLAGTYKRLGELYDAKGDRERALTFYDRFVDLWKNADPELQPRVQEVKRRAQTLRRTTG